MASAVKRPLDPKPSPQEWLGVKSDIERLYVVQCHNLRYVAHVLKHHRGFVATLRMFKSRIKEWKFDQKTIRQADWRFMFQEYVRRKELSPPKETVFLVCQDNQGRVTKQKTIKHIRTYMRRKQVSEETFLASPSDSAKFPHIRPQTPPLSLASSSAAPSPSSQVDGDNGDASTPASGTDGASRGTGHVHPQHLTADMTRQIPCSHASGWRSDHGEVDPTPCDSFPSCQGESSWSQRRVLPCDRRSECPPPAQNCLESSTTTNEIMLYGSQRLAIQTLALDKLIPCEDPELYRLMARLPSLVIADMDDIDDDLSAVDLTRALSDFDEDIYDEQDRRSLLHVPDQTDVISSRLKSFKPDADEARAFRWASRYFLACILQGRMRFSLAKAARASANKIFERMLELETRSPTACPTIPYVPSHRSRFILSGLTLMTTVLKAHGREDMLKKFLLDSRRSIAEFFQMENHPLSAPYSYLLSLMDDESFDDDFWEQTLSGAHRTIRHVWNGGPNAVVSHYYWAWHVLKRKRYEQALDELKTCYKTATDMFGQYHIFTINCLSTIARALAEQEKCHEAMSWLVDTIKRSKDALGPEHPFCYKLIERLGDLHQRLGDLASAEATFRDVVEGRKKSLGLHHGHTSFIAHKLADLLAQQGKQAERDNLVRELDEEHEEQQLQHYKEKQDYFPDSRQEGFTNPSLNICTLLHLH